MVGFLAGVLVAGFLGAAFLATVDFLTVVLGFGDGVAGFLVGVFFLAVSLTPEVLASLKARGF